MRASTLHVRGTVLRASRRQRGAALVIGLLLLAVITLLAVGGMSSASVELILAGNTQLQTRAFQASETGIEQMLAHSNTVPGADPLSAADLVVPGQPNDHFDYEVTSELHGAAQPAIWGNKIDSFSSYHFKITVTGKAPRGTQVIHDQGLYVISPYNPSISGSGPLN
jgi:type IV pilus assembly protein PilX